MTKGQLDVISQEITEIELRLSTLDTSNTFENRTQERLMYRLSALEQELNMAVAQKRKNRLRLVNLDARAV
jgi:hypothetical protein